MKINKVLNFPRRIVVEIVKDLGFTHRDVQGPLQFIKETPRGRLHIILDAQQKKETRIRIHQDIIFASTMGGTYHFTEDSDDSPLEVFNKIEAELYKKKMEDYDGIRKI
jgi:hypothetical protein